MVKNEQIMRPRNETENENEKEKKNKPGLEAQKKNE